MTISLELAAMILAASAVTYASRAAPFALLERSETLRRAFAPDAPLAALGPILIASIAAMVAAPDVVEALDRGRGALYVVALSASAGFMLWRKDAGVAALIGIGCYWLGLETFASAP